MADFVVVLRRAVENLEQNTAETRAELYGKARAALLGQLRTLDPPLSEAELEAQTRALDQAIVDTERSCAEAERANAPAQPDPDAAVTPPVPPASPPPPDTAETPPAPPPPADPHKSFRSAVEESAQLGTASATAARSARDALGHIDRDQGEAPAPPPAGPAPAPAAPTAPRAPAPGAPQGAKPQGAAAYPGATDDGNSEGRGAGIAVWLILAAVVLSIAGIGWWQRDALGEMVAALTAEQGVEDAKIDDRVPTPGNGEEGADTTQTGGQQSAQGPVAGETGDRPALEEGEREAQAILVEETEAGSGAANTLGGSVDWELVEETAPDGSTQNVIRATVRVPDADMSLALAIRRNTDPELPATHTVELLFDVPPDFGGGGISTVPGIIMKANPQSSGQPLVGAVVPVTDNFFLVGLSETEFDRRRNISEMKSRAFIDIPLAYENGGRAVLSIAKGESGEQVFQQAFEAWGQ